MKILLTLIAVFAWIFVISASQDRSACNLPKVVGPCQAAGFVFFYNQANDQCEDFIYGGCAGNANRFVTRAACEAACKLN